MTANEENFHLVLVDGSGFIFRAFYALPPLTSPDGIPTNAVYGFCNMLLRLMREHIGTHLAIIFDAGRHTFRNDLYQNYKSNRPEPPADLRPQFALVRTATARFGIPTIEKNGWEADDLIASYARKAIEQNGLCTIVSSDKDLMQLIRPGVTMVDPIRQKMIGPEEIKEKFGVTPENIPYVQSLMGDPTDNVPGIPGIGLKTASTLIQEYGTLEAVLTAAKTMKSSKRRDNLLRYADDARLSLQLVKLHDNVPLPEPIDNLIIKPADTKMLKEWLGSMGFHSLLARLTENKKTDTQPDKKPFSDKSEASSFSQEPVNQRDHINIFQAPYTNYRTILDPVDLITWITQAQQQGYIAIDTETSGLNPLKDELIGFSLAITPGQACYIPIHHSQRLDSNINQMPLHMAISALSPLLSDNSILKIFHNAKFDIMTLQKAGFGEVISIEDTMLMSYVLSAGQHGHGMDELSKLHLDHRPISYDEITGKGRNRISFAEVDIHQATVYAAEDADVTLRLWYTLRPQLRLQKVLRLYEDIERPLIYVLADMEKAGITIDANVLKDISHELSARMKEIENQVLSLTERNFNIASPRQLGEILFDDMQLPGAKKLKSGSWSTDSAVLQGLADQGYNLPAEVLAWRQMAKLKSNYTDTLLKDMDPDSCRIHTSFQMSITNTGRLSSNNPNLQNIPIRTKEGNRIRAAFVAPKNYVLLSADYSQIELRLLAHNANIKQLKQSFQRGEDIHSRTAAEVFGIPIENMDPMTRRRAKAINFGIIYGISPFGLSRQLGISPAEAKNYIDAYFDKYPEIRSYMSTTIANARKNGFVSTPLGRRIYVPGIQDRNPTRRSYAERQAINGPLQGEAADIIKKAMVIISRDNIIRSLPLRMLLQVHDELLFEVHKDETDKAARIVKSIMETVVTLSVPLMVETGTGLNWTIAH